MARQHQRPQPARAPVDRVRLIDNGRRIGEADGVAPQLAQWRREADGSGATASSGPTWRSSVAAAAAVAAPPRNRRPCRHVAWRRCLTTATACSRRPPARTPARSARRRSPATDRGRRARRDRLVVAEERVPLLRRARLARRHRRHAVRRVPGISPSSLRPFCVASSTSTRRFLRAVRRLLERRVEGVVAQVLDHHEHIVLPRHGLPAAVRVRLDTTHRQSSGPLAPPTVAPCIVGGLLKMPRVNVSGGVSAALSMFTHSQARSAGGPCLSASGVGPAPCGCRGRVAAPDAGGGDGTPGGGGGRGAPLGVGSRPGAHTPRRSRRYVSRKPWRRAAAGRPRRCAPEPSPGGASPGASDTAPPPHACRAPSPAPLRARTRSPLVLVAAHALHDRALRVVELRQPHIRPLRRDRRRCRGCLRRLSLLRCLGLRLAVVRVARTTVLRGARAATSPAASRAWASIGAARPADTPAASPPPRRALRLVTAPGVRAWWCSPICILRTGGSVAANVPSAAASRSHTIS